MTSTTNLPPSNNTMPDRLSSQPSRGVFGVTQQGKACKLCIRKGGFCHHHVGQARNQMTVHAIGQPAVLTSRNDGRQRQPQGTFGVTQKGERCKLCIRQGGFCHYHVGQASNATRTVPSQRLARTPTTVPSQRQTVVQSSSSNKGQGHQRTLGMTQQGEPCELCIRKGDFCHHHEGQRNHHVHGNTEPNTRRTPHAGGNQVCATRRQPRASHEEAHGHPNVRSHRESETDARRNETQSRRMRSPGAHDGSIRVNNGEQHRPSENASGRSVRANNEQRRRNGTSSEGAAHDRAVEVEGKHVLNHNEPQDSASAARHLSQQARIATILELFGEPLLMERLLNQALVHQASNEGGSDIMWRDHTTAAGSVYEVPSHNSVDSRTTSTMQSRTVDATETTRPRMVSPGRETQGPSTECSICLEDFQANRAREFLPCGHSFHRDCMNHWRNYRQACPLCQAPVPRSFGRTETGFSGRTEFEFPPFSTQTSGTSFA